MVPILTKLFASNDRGIRRGLLENITTYGPHLPDKVVEEQVRAGSHGKLASMMLRSLQRGTDASFGNKLCAYWLCKLACTYAWMPTEAQAGWFLRCPLNLY